MTGGEGDDAEEVYLPDEGEDSGKMLHDHHLWMQCREFGLNRGDW